MAQSTPASTIDHLSRLAAKPGVQSTLVLSKSDGSILQSSGLVRKNISLPSNPSTLSPDSQNSNSNISPYNGSTDVISSQDGADAEDGNTKGNTAEDVAKMVFTFVTAAKGFAEGMDATDEVKLLRMRTRKNEIIIVPDAKFLLVVIHDTPSA